MALTEEYVIIENSTKTEVLSFTGELRFVLRDGKRILQQRVLSHSSGYSWRDVPLEAE